MDKKVFAEVSEKAKVTERLRMNFNLHDSLAANAQCLLNALEIGTILPVHRHCNTTETYIFLRGKILVMFYNEMEVETEWFVLNALDGNYGIDVPIGQRHTLEVLEQGSVVFEVKDGSYIPFQPEDILF